MDLPARGTCVPAVTARGAIVEKGQKRCKAIGEYLNNHRKVLWERADSQMRYIRQHLSRLIFRLREQARSHSLMAYSLTS